MLTNIYLKLNFVGNKSDHKKDNDNRPFAGPGHMTYPPLDLRPGTLWVPDMKRAGKTK